MSELKSSGYSEKDRYEILKSGINRYDKLKKESEEGKRPFYRSRNFERKERDDAKTRKKKNWFKSEENCYSSVFFVPPTPNSILLRMLKKTEAENRIGDKSRIKFVETCGRKYSEYLKSSNPFRAKCDKSEKCFVCLTSPVDTDCKASNICYSLTCKLCKKQYHGESSRCGYLRGLEHLRALERQSKHSVLFKHITAEHKEEVKQVGFEMKVTGRFRDCLSRQVSEGLNIKNQPPDLLLNSKAEFYGPCVKRKAYVD